MNDIDEMKDLTPEEFLTGEFDVSNAISFLVDIEVISDYADEYGEPGYSLDNPEGFFAIGDWWCRAGSYGGTPCDFTETYGDGSKKVHGVDLHYKALFEKLEEAGMETAFDDEWVIIYGVKIGEYPNIEIKNLAYRTQSDSYHWQSSIMWDEEQGEYLTPHDPITDWIEVCLEKGIGMVGPWSEDDLIEQGFREYNCNYENGWFDGQDDDPDKIMKALKERMGETHDLLPYLKENSQFYFKFCVFVRAKNNCSNCGTAIEEDEALCDNCEGASE